MLYNKLQFILQRLFSDVATCQFTYPHRYLEYKHQGHWYDFKTIEVPPLLKMFVGFYLSSKFLKFAGEGGSCPNEGPVKMCQWLKNQQQ